MSGIVIFDHEDNEMMRPYNVVAGSQAKPVAAEDQVVAPQRTFALDQNYPNPFNPSTEIHFALPEDSHVLLALYNNLGQEVQTLINTNAPAGSHSVKLDAENLASGVYYYRLQAGNHTAMRKMLLVR